MQYSITADDDGVYGPGSRFIDTRGYTFVTFYVSTLGGTSVDVRPVGTAAPATLSTQIEASPVGLEALSYRTTGNAAYASSLATINGGSHETFHLDPADQVPFVALELDNMVGDVVVTATVYMS
jgi:hypothetical protein